MRSYGSHRSGRFHRFIAKGGKQGKAGRRDGISGPSRFDRTRRVRFPTTCGSLRRPVTVTTLEEARPGGSECECLRILGAGGCREGGSTGLAQHLHYLISSNNKLGQVPRPALPTSPPVSSPINKSRRLRSPASSFDVARCGFSCRSTHGVPETGPIRDSRRIAGWVRGTPRVNFTRRPSPEIRCGLPKFATRGLCTE